MNEYIKAWNKIIMNGSFDNTYKMAWAKSIVELSLLPNPDSSNCTIFFDFRQIAELYLKYYWNQTIYFDLIQGSNLKKIPEILGYTKTLISKYFTVKNSCLPERFEKIDFVQLALARDYDATLRQIIDTLKQDVCYRFKRVNGIEYEIYTLDRKQGIIGFQPNQIQWLADYSDLLFQVINYRWTQMLESFNHSPRISMKVRAIDEGKMRRNNLSAFHRYLDLELNDGQRSCFHCGQPIGKDDLSVDHVIPWSFMFSDDVWNLVYCHKSENSSKSNSISSEEVISRLEARNKLLVERFELLNIKKDKIYDELKLAIEKDYVRKFWVASKG